MTLEKGQSSAGRTQSFFQLKLALTSAWELVNFKQAKHSASSPNTNSKNYQSHIKWYLMSQFWVLEYQESFWSTKVGGLIIGKERKGERERQTEKYTHMCIHIHTVKWNNFLRHGLHQWAKIYHDFFYHPLKEIKAFCWLTELDYILGLPWQSPMNQVT